MCKHDPIAGMTCGSTVVTSTEPGLLTRLGFAQLSALLVLTTAQYSSQQGKIAAANFRYLGTVPYRTKACGAYGEPHSLAYKQVPLTLSSEPWARTTGRVACMLEHSSLTLRVPSASGVNTPPLQLHPFQPESMPVQTHEERSPALDGCLLITCGPSPAASCCVASYGGVRRSGGVLLGGGQSITCCSHSALLFVNACMILLSGRVHRTTLLRSHWTYCPFLRLGDLGTTPCTWSTLQDV